MSPATSRLRRRFVPAHSARGLGQLIDASLGRRPLDLAVTGGRVLNVFTGHVEEGDIGISGGTIVAFGELPSAKGRPTRVLKADGGFVLPGFIDPHFHMGGTQLSAGEWARVLLARGTTTVATDFAEIYSYAGPSGVRRMLDEGRAAGLRLWFLPPVHLFGLEDQGTFRHPPDPDEMIDMLGWPEAVGINEPPPAEVLSKNRDVLRLVAAARSNGQVFAGHLPGVGRSVMQAYAAAGGTSCHESTSAAEAGAKLALGVWPMMRFGSGGPDLPNLLPLIAHLTGAARWSMLCTDDQEVGDLLRNGNADQKLRLAVAGGVDPGAAVAMATINPALYYGMAGSVGSISPGKAADLVVVEDLTAFAVRRVVAGGALVGKGARSSDDPSPTLPRSLQSAVRWPRALRASDLEVPGSGARALVRVIVVRDGSLVSEAETANLRVVDGHVQADPSGDVLKIAVIDRHSGRLRAGLGFVKGLGLVRGAVATTYCHPHQSLLVTGTSEEEMVIAANDVAAMGGGVAVADGDHIVTRWPLPLIGVFSLEPAASAADGLLRVNQALRRRGCTLSSPVLGLAFVGLTTIPHYGLTERGLFDVDAGRFVPVVMRNRIHEVAR
jgi:adenine deaminase